MRLTYGVLLSMAGASLAIATLVHATAPTGGGGKEAAVERGNYLVTVMGCGDCHTPWKMGEQGPEPDMTLLLSGHPEALEMPAAPALPPGPWMLTASGTMTAWAGPWGTSFTANITSDPETGIGSWTEEEFVGALRSGRHMGRGRPILPPMPWPAFQNCTDEDLGAIYAYLMTVPPIHNKVPNPVPPAGN